MFIFQSMPPWASGVCGLLLLITILAPIHAIVSMIGFINAMETPDISGVKFASGEVKHYKDIVAWFFVHQALAVFGMGALLIAVSLGKALPVAFGIAVAALCANALRLRSRVSVS